MGAFSSKLIKGLIVFCVIIVIGYVFVKHRQRSEMGTTPTMSSISEDLKEADMSAKGPSQRQKDSKKSEDKSAGDQQKSFLENALNALNDPNVRARVQAVWNLRYHSSPEAVNLLRKFLEDKASVVAQEAIHSLAYIGLNSELKEVVIEILAQEAMKKRFPQCGEALILAAGIGEDRLIPTVSKFIFEEKREEALFAAVRALAVIESPKCINLLGELISKKKKDPIIHQIAFDTLASIGTNEALALLKERHEASSSDEDKTSSALALAKLNKPEFNQMLAEELEEESMEEETIALLATSRAAPEIFGNLLN